MSTGVAPVTSASGVRIKKEIRIALAMSGGIALTVYEAGVAHEFWRAATAVDAGNDPCPEAPNKCHEKYRELVGKPERGFVVDILTGASAGGINTIMLGSALVTGGDFGQLHDLWLEKGDLKVLRYPGTPTDSLLDSAAIRDTIKASLKENLDAAQAKRRMQGKDLIAVITRTNLAGRRRILTDALDHRTAVVTKEDPITFTAEDFGQKNRLDVLTNAALATSAFPVVFPVVEMEKSLDEAATSFYADGGLLDNQPVEHAIKVIRDKKAVYLTQRYVVFVEPDPDPLKEPQPRRPSPGQIALQMPMLGIKGNIWNAVVDREDFNRRWDHYQSVENMLAWNLDTEVPDDVRFDELFIAHDPGRYARWRALAELAFNPDPNRYMERAWMHGVIVAARDMDYYLRWLRVLISHINEVANDVARKIAHKVVEHQQALTVQGLMEMPGAPHVKSVKAILYDLLAELDEALYPRKKPDDAKSPYNLGRSIGRWQPLLYPDPMTNESSDAWALRIELDLFLKAVQDWTSNIPVPVAQKIKRRVGELYLDPSYPQFKSICIDVCGQPEPPPDAPAVVGEALFDSFKRRDRKTYILDTLTDLHLK